MPTVRDPSCARCDHLRSQHTPANDPHFCAVCPCPGFVDPVSRLGRELGEIKKDVIQTPRVSGTVRGLLFAAAVIGTMIVLALLVG